MDPSFIYSDLTVPDLGSLGWFQPKVPFSTLGCVNYVKFINDPVIVSRTTLVSYFPGCFAEFHAGHLDVVKQAVACCQSITDDYLVVIAPANSDYTTEKYGKDSLFATNKYRYDRICSVLQGIEGNVAIDLNTMLNYRVDYNFTDLLYDFITRDGLSYHGLFYTPHIVCGKDRDYFQKLEYVTDKLSVLYVDDTTGASSSAHIRSVGNTKVVKKNLLLRCNTEAEYELFVKYFHDQYNEIVLALLEDEIQDASRWNDKEKFDITICKDYTFLPYVKVHRRFDDPLSSVDGHITDGNFKGLKVLDSDVFSGGTRKFIEQSGGSLYAVYDFSNKLDEYELLDISDFYKPEFAYPYVDISSRCSMQAFDLAAHINYNEFQKELRCKT